MGGTNGEAGTQIITTPEPKPINETTSALNDLGTHINPQIELAKKFLAESKGIEMNSLTQSFIEGKVKPAIEDAGVVPFVVPIAENLSASSDTATVTSPLETADVEINSDLKAAEQSSIDSDPDLESMLETERQQKIQETQEAWVNLINAMKESPLPFFAISISKEMLFLIKSTRDPSNPDSEIYVVITKDGPKATQATKETRDMIIKLYLNPTEDLTVNKLEVLEMSPLLISETSDPVSPVIKESQEMAAKIRKIKEESRELDNSKNFADKLTASFRPQQASPAMSHM
jgi:hypothetical protein